MNKVNKSSFMFLIPVKSPDFFLGGGGLRILYPVSPLSRTPPPPLNFRSRLRISADLLAISLYKIICFYSMQLWHGPSQLIGTFLLKMITDEGSDDYHKQWLLLIKDKQKFINI